MRSPGTNRPSEAFTSSAVAAPTVPSTGRAKSRVGASGSSPSMPTAPAMPAYAEESGASVTRSTTASTNAFGPDFTTR